MTDPVNIDQSFLDIEVSPKVGYLYQVIAREDKGMILGVDYNKSKTTKWRTSPNHKELKPGSIKPFEEFNDGDEVYHAGNDPVLTDQEVRNALAPLTIETLVIVIVAGLLFLLIVIGIMYKLCCRKKSREYDDEDEDEESGEGEDDNEQDENQWEDVENEGLQSNPNSRHINRNYSNRSNGFNYKSNLSDD
jgi:hypothetical protein